MKSSIANHNMYAVEITEPGGPEKLQLCDRPMPNISDHEVLIEVGAAGINRPDIVQRLGLYPPPPGASDIPGLEVAGTIVATGKFTSKFGIGDTVCALLNGGGYAQYASTHESLCLPIPKNLSLNEAAAIPETFFTVWHNLFQKAHLKTGETLLIHGGSSGIGSSAIQLAKAFDITVYTTAGSEQKCQFCKGLGADLSINYREQDFVTEIKEVTAGKGVNVILDMVGGDYIQRNMKAASVDGRIASIAFLQGAKTEINFMPMLLKRLQLTGSTLRSQPLENKTAIAQELQTNVWPLLDSGIIKPIIDSSFALKEAAKAHQRMESGKHMGKIILEVPR